MIDIYEIVDKFNKKVIEFENIKLDKYIFLDDELECALKENIAQNLRIYSLEVITLCFNDYTERYGGSLSDYSYHMGDEYIREICQRFPILVNKLRIRISFYVNYVNEILSNLYKLRKDMNFKKICNITFDLGDSHKSGKSTCLINLDGKDYIYKPRTSVIEKRFNEYVAKFIEGYGYDIRSYSNFSLCEKINYESPVDDKDIKKLYYNFGILSAILYILNSADNHFENIILNKQYPYLIDLECTILHKNNSNNIDKNVQAYRNFFSYVDKSIIGTNLFPFILKPNDMEVSGLCGKGTVLENFEYSNKKLVFENNKFVYKTISPYINDQQNRVYINSKVIHPIHYIKQIKRGFEYYCRYLLKDKENSVEELKGILENQQVRYIMRPTHVYSKYLQTSNEPYYLQGVDVQNELFNNLDANDDCINKDILDYELKTLRVSDIPVFYAKSNKNDLYLGDTRNKVKNYFRRSVLKEIEIKIFHLNEREISRQLNIIGTSLLINSFNTGNKQVVENIDQLPKNLKFLKKDSLSIETKIISTFIESDSEIQGIYPSLVQEKLVISGMNSSLYEMGGAILMLFFDRKKFKLNDDIFFKILKTIRFTKLYGDKNISAISGLGSYLYLAVTFYRDTDNLKYLDLIEFCLEEIDSYYEQNLENLDYMNGISSTIVLLVNILNLNLKLNISIEKKIDNIIQKYITNIIEYSDDFIKVRGAGLGHGLAGLYYAISKVTSRYYVKDGQKILEKLIKEEEKKYLSPPINNYIDPRSNKEAGLFFCYGLPGILQAQMRLIQSGIKSIDELAKNKFNFLLENILKDENYLKDMGYCVCHGLASVLDVVVDGYRRNYLDEDKYEEVCDLLLKKISVNNKSDYGYSEDIFLFGTGLAGKLYSYSRYSNTKIPSIFMLEFE